MYLEKKMKFTIQFYYDGEDYDLFVKQVNDTWFAAITQSGDSPGNQYKYEFRLVNDIVEFMTPDDLQLQNRIWETIQEYLAENNG